MKRFLLAVCTVLLLGCGNAASEGSPATDSSTAEQAVSNEPIHVKVTTDEVVPAMEDPYDITVSFTVDGNEVKDFQMTAENGGKLWNETIEPIVSEGVNKKGLGFLNDVISGATRSSEVIKKAVVTALKDEGLNPEDYGLTENG
ncbi:MAG: FMN-binding protein [Solobacterium sp.]|nr:FMN-binding protein [Solobacterium sp.]